MLFDCKCLLLSVLCGFVVGCFSGFSLSKRDVFNNILINYTLKR